MRVIDLAFASRTARDDHPLTERQKKKRGGKRPKIELHTLLPHALIFRVFYVSFFFLSLWVVVVVLGRTPPRRKKGKKKRHSQRFWFWSYESSFKNIEFLKAFVFS